MPTQTAIGQHLDRFGDAWRSLFRRDLRPAAALAIFAGLLVSILLYPAISAKGDVNIPLTVESNILASVPTEIPLPPTENFSSSATLESQIGFCAAEPLPPLL